MVSPHFEIFIGAPNASYLKPSVRERPCEEGGWGWESVSGTLSYAEGKIGEVKQKDDKSSNDAGGSFDPHSSVSAVNRSPTHMNPALVEPSRALDNDRSKLLLQTNRSVAPVFMGPTTQPDWLIPPATFEAAGLRISLLYRNMIFRDEDDEDEGDVEEEIDADRDEYSRLDRSKEGT